MTSSPSEARAVPDDVAEAGDADRTTYVVAEVADAQYCIDVARVREIVPVGRITVVPGAEPAILGVLNVRGRVMALADLSAALRGPGCDGQEDECPTRGAAMVLDLEASGEIAVAVHEVIDVIELPAGALQPPPSFGLGGAARYALAVAALSTGLAVVLDVEALFGSAAAHAAANDVGTGGTS